MFHLLDLRNVPILEQLRLEEALMRADHRNWCLLNTGSSPAIVMGISGKAEKLLDLERVGRDGIPLIKRFSGGGTVYIDPQTIFVTFICNSDAFAVKNQPRPIMEWSEQIYAPLLEGFSLRENDYVFGDKKFGGNAQYIQKKRWLHHSSLLWDYDETKMEYLLLPEKRPKYRQERAHKDFLCPLKPHFPSKEGFLKRLVSHIKEQFETEEVSFETIAPILQKPHRKGTRLLSV